MAAALNTGGIARRVRDRLDRDPRAGHVAVAVLTAAGMLALPLAASNLLDSIGRVRSAAATYSAITVGADSSALALERALGAERIAAVAIDVRNLGEARARFEAEAAAVLGNLHRIRHPERLPPVLREALAELPSALTTSLTELRRRIPAAPRGRGVAAPLPPGFGAVDGADEIALAGPRALVSRISAAADTARRGDVRKIEQREHAAATGAALVVASALLLLAGAVSRLIAGRQRLEVARARERLQADRLARAVNGMREGVALFSPEMRLILRNARFAETAGLDPEACAIGTSFATVAEALASGVPPVLAEVLSEVLAGDRRETPVEMRLGARVLEVFRAAMPGGGEILTVADVTERIEREAVARRAVKLEALGRLTGGVAHDFNNLLQGLSANLETLAALDAHASGAQRRERFEASLDLVERGTRLTRQLLSFTRTRTTEATAIDTAGLLRGLEDLLEHTIGDRIELQLVLDPGLWPVLADRSGLENAILNLAINARDAMPDGGTISIVGTNQAGVGTSQAGVGTDAPDGERASVLICVADSGIGMDAEGLRRATEPFFTTKPEGAGSGLGLAMVSGFAAAAGGAFTLESEVGRGTRATLRLPRATALPAAADADGLYGALLRGAPVRGLGETILLVEDDHAVRRAVRSGLQAIGYRVAEAATIDGACAWLAGDMRPDLVLSDVMLPGSLGPPALLAAVRAISATMPVVFNTGDPEAPVARALPFDERTVLLVKPWRLEELARLMRSLLDAPPAAAARLRATHQAP